MKKIVLLFLCIVFSIQIDGQSCVIEDDIAIIDRDTTAIQFFIESANKNQLNNASQFLKEVALKFEHLKLTDIKIDIVSPSGQRVTLVGPIDKNGINTRGFEWDVIFKTLSENVSPDDDFADRWNSNNIWTDGNTYNGSYHPYQGDLKDINVGSLVGEWRLEIIDEIKGNNDFNPSTNKPLSFVSKLGLNFNDESGFICNTCKPERSNFNNSDIESCQGSRTLKFTLDASFSTTDSKYAYGYLTVSSNGKTTFSNTPQMDLTDQPVGKYEIYGLHYRKDQFYRIKDQTYQHTFDQIRKGFICGKLSTDKVTVNIVDAPPIITEQKIICEGESVTINGNTFDKTGKYKLYTALQNGCDSISYLDLKISIIDASFTASKAQFSCASQTITLSAQGESELTYTWLDLNGDEIGKGKTLEISRPGRYTLMASNENCTASFSKIIGSDVDYSVLRLEGDNLYCKGKQVTITPKLANGIKSIKWTSTSPFTQWGNQIITSTIGKYTAEVLSNNGCVQTKTFEVKNELEYFEISNIRSSLTCKKPTLNLFLKGNLFRSSDDYTIAWYRDGIEILNGQKSNFRVSQKGRYYALISNTTRGCTPIKTDDVVITDDRSDFKATITVSNRIDCNTSATLTCNTSSNIKSFIWYFVGDTLEEVGNGQKITVSNPGRYILIAEDNAGCSLSKSVTVEGENTLYVPLPDPFIKTCDKDEYFLTNVDPNIDYTWTFPNQETTTESNPLIIYIGEYRLKAVHKITGCIYIGKVKVVNDETRIPNFNYDITPIQCGGKVGSVEITNPNPDYLIEWSGPKVLTDIAQPKIDVGAQGFYIDNIKPKDDLTCELNFVNYVQQNRAAKLNLEAEDLNCQNDEVKINVTRNTNPDKIRWELNSKVVSTEKEPTVTQPGEYITYYYYDKTKCFGEDTITVARKITLPKINKVRASKETITCKDSTIVAIDHNLLKEEFLRYELVSDTRIDSSYNKDNITIYEPGEYKIRLFGVGECVDSTTIQIKGDTIPPTFTMAKSGDFKCDKPTVRINVNDLNSFKEFTWQDNPNIDFTDQLQINVSAPGTYYFTATGNNNCPRTDSITIEDIRVFPKFSITGDTTITCKTTSQSLKIDADKDNYSIQWILNNSEVAQGYNVDLTEGGQYFVNVKNDAQCVKTDTLNIRLDTAKVNYNLDILSKITCDSTEVLVLANSNDEDITLEWKGSLRQNNNRGVYDKPGQYVVTGYGLNGCKRNTNINIELDTTQIKVDSVTFDILKCRALSYLHVFSQTKIRNYKWSGPNNYNSTEADPILLEPGMYNVTIYGENGCSDNGKVVVDDERQFPEINISEIYRNCDGSPSTFTLEDIDENNYNIIWEGKEQQNKDYFERNNNAQSSIPGFYEVIVSDKRTLCQSRTTFQFKDDYIYPTFDMAADTLFCYGTAKIYPKNISDYKSLEWSGPNNFYSKDSIAYAPELGTYGLSATNKYKCTTTNKIDIPNGRLFPQFSIQQLNPYMCTTNKVKLTARPTNTTIDKVSYEWAAPDNTTESSNEKEILIVNKPDVTYKLKMIDNRSKCFTEGEYTFSEEPSTFTAFEYETINPVCDSNNGTGKVNLISMNGQHGPYNVFINGLFYGEETQLKGFSSGKYTIDVIDKYGCKVSEDFVIEQAFEPYLKMPRDTAINMGMRYQYQAESNADIANQVVFEWKGNFSNPGGYSQDVTVIENSVVSLRMVDADGCEVSGSFFLNVIDPYYPFANIFSPNVDSANDYFFIPKNPGFESLETFYIYDRNGGMVFDGSESRLGDPSTGWNGQVDGGNAEEGVYLVQTVIKLVTGEIKKYNGTLTLIR